MNTGENKESVESLSGISAGQLKKGLHYAVVEIGFAGVMGNIMGGVILTGFALALGATDYQIGILAALPAITNLVQIHASYLVEKRGDRRGIVLASVWAGRSIWIPILLLPFIPIDWVSSHLMSIFLGLILLYYISNSTVGLAFLSWLADLCPEDMRGRFFANRNFAGGFTGILAAIAGGAFLDLWAREFPVKEFPELRMVGFAIVLFVGLIFGWLSNVYLGKIPHPPVVRASREEPFLSVLMRPFRDRNFRMLILFRTLLDVSINIAGPFFAVYMIRKMGFGYTFINSMAALAGATSLVSMNIWGRLSDRYGNKPVLAINVIGKAIFPLLWLWTSPETFFLYIIIHLTGVFDAGLNLTAANLVLEMAPREYNSVYLGVFSTVVGAASAIAPIVGGTVLHNLSGMRVDLYAFVLDEYKFIFLISGILRFATLPLLRKIHEPEAKEMIHVIRVLWNVRGLDPLEGFEQALNYLLAPAKFIGNKISEIVDKVRREDEEQS
jgi:MFS family permease